MEGTESSIGASIPSGANTSSVESTPSSPTTDVTPAPSEQTAGIANAGVQGNQEQQATTTTEDDVLAGVPSLDELNQLPDEAQNKKSLVQMRKAIEETFKPKIQGYEQKLSIFQPAEDRFESADQLRSVLTLHDSILGWESDPDSGEPIPATQAGAELLATQYPQHADFLVADLLGLPTTDPQTGRQVPRIDYVLESLAADPEQRAKALKILGGVEPSAVAPQWQPSDEELALVRPELQDVYRKLPYEDREELKLASPDFINRTLEREKLTQELAAQTEASNQRQQAEQQQRETYINQQAQAAGQEYLGTQLNQALTTFHESVVQQCNFIKPLDTANLPQGITPEQAATINQQVQASNKAEAAQITGLIVSLFNPQTKAYVLPLLKEIGAVDDKLLNQLDTAASTFGNNARNFGNLTFRQKLTANGNYQPAQDVTQMNNEAQRALKTMIGYANQIRGKLMEQRSKFFELTATQHNSTLNSAAQVRPPINGQGYNPTAAPADRLPTGKLTRDEINRLYG